MTSSTPQYSGYTMGHTRATTASHSARTIHSDAAFLLPHIKSHHRILDIGCGPGTITAGFLSLVPQGSVVGVDISNEVLQQARENTQALIESTPDVARGAILFQEGNVVTGLPFGDDEFDVVFASQTLLHLPGQNTAVTALKEMRRVVKSGGIVATRDGAGMLFYPEFGLEKLWAGNLLKGIGHTEWPGPKMRGYYRSAGFDVDGKKEDGQSIVVVGVGTTVYGGNEEGRRTHAKRFMSRLLPGEPFRESWIKAGITGREITEVLDACEKWASTEDAWTTTIQSEIIAWK